MGHPTFHRTVLAPEGPQTAHVVGQDPGTSRPAVCVVIVLALCVSEGQLLFAGEPNAVAKFAHAHDRGIWNCLCQLLHVDPSQSEEIVLSATLPVSLGGLGLRNAARTSVSACWASWADALPMIRARHRAVADCFVRELEGAPESPFLGAVADAVRSLAGTMVQPPRGKICLQVPRPGTHKPDEFEPGGFRQRWQHEAAARVEQQFPPYLFRVILLRRLRMPLPPLPVWPSNRFVSPPPCACARSGVLGRREFCSSHVQGGWRTGQHELFGERPGPPSVRHRQPPFGKWWWMACPLRGVSLVRAGTPKT